MVHIIEKSKPAPKALRRKGEEPDAYLARLLNTHPDVASVAEELGVTRTSVYRWMQRYGIWVVRREVSES